MKSHLNKRLLLGVFFLQLMPLSLQAQVARPPLAPPSSSLDKKMLPTNSSFPSTSNETQGMMSRVPVTPERALDILDFWFGTLPHPVFFPKDKLSVWFAGTPDIDRIIEDNFSQDVIYAMRGEYNNWRETPSGRLALILLLDQFPRHIYRNTPQAFRSDPMARGLVLEGLNKRDDKHLFPIERAFFYLPLEHAEDIRIQELAIASYQQLVADSPVEIKPEMEDFLNFAALHHQQIARFGRFPHRNAILERESTPEEVVFLNQWGKSSF